MSQSSRSASGETESRREDALDRILANHFENSSLTSRIHVDVSRSARDFQSRSAVHQEQLRFRHFVEADIAERARNLGPQHVPGICRPCARATRFLLDMEYCFPSEPNWRERMVCEHCGLNNRLRMSIDLFGGINSRGQISDVYITEQVTPAYEAFRTRCRLVGSEFVGPGIVGGTVINGVRHEDLTALSFRDKSFDQVLSFDVLEHIPDASKACRELARILRSGGSLVLTAPFDVNADRNLCRARIGGDGKIVHLEAPEYHGDPVNPEGGILCFWWFGWELLGLLKESGFRDAAVITAWSGEAGYLGQSLPVIVATR